MSFPAEWIPTVAAGALLGIAGFVIDFVSSSNARRRAKKPDTSKPGI
jgi:hypothetical protein